MSCLGSLYSSKESPDWDIITDIFFSPSNVQRTSTTVNYPAGTKCLIHFKIYLFVSCKVYSIFKSRVLPISYGRKP